MTTELSLRLYFSSIWPPFVVYLAAYFVAWLLHVPVLWLTYFFLFLHFSHVSLLAWLFWKRSGFSTYSASDLVFWIGLALLFLIPGAYFEYPSDPWEHLRRTFSWTNSPYVHLGPYKERFSYYFNWTGVALLPIAYRTPVLSLFSAFWQLVLAAQIYLFLGTLKLDKPERWIGVLCWVCLFGTGLFGIRYYALSSTPLAMLAMFAALGLFQRGLDGEKKAWLCIPLLGLLIWMTHPPQELVGFCVGALALTLVHWNPPRKWVLRFLMAGFAAGASIRWLSPSWIEELSTIHRLSPFAGAAVGGGGHRISSTLGLHGILAIVGAFYLLRSHRQLAVLALLPVVLLVFPLTALPILAAVGPDSAYRVLYAFPTSTALGVALYSGLKTRFSQPQAFYGTVVVVAVFGMLYMKPFYGRLFFQVYPQQAEFTYKRFDETAQWFEERRRKVLVERNCRFITEDNLYFVLATHLGLPLWGASRGHRFRDLVLLDQHTSLEEFLKELRICGVLLPDTSKIPEAPEPFIGKASGHWNRKLLDRRSFVPPNFDRTESILKKLHWSMTPVPPDFRYWEPPQNGLGE